MREFWHLWAQENCPYCGDDHVMGVSVLWMCPYCGDDHIMGVSILWMCPYCGDDHIMGVSILWMCPYYGGVHIMGCRYYEGVRKERFDSHPFIPDPSQGC